MAWVWSFPLQCDPSTEASLLTLLSLSETARAARFATPELRRRFVVSHGVLRLILSSFTGRPPHAIQILSEARGKPYVMGRRPHFSLAHAEDVAVVAVANGGPVGVDVERVRADIGMDEFSRQALTDADGTEIEALPPEFRLRARFQAWTRREALAKATGEGLRERPSVSPLAWHTWELHLDEAHVGSVTTLPTTTQVVCETIPHLSLVLSRFSPT